MIQPTETTSYQSHQSIILYTDRYLGLHITLTTSLSTYYLYPYLKYQLKQALTNHKTAIWMHLDKNNFPILSFLCDLHFKIHHGYGDKITLYRWLLPQKDLVVPYSLIIVGCGAIIIKDDAILLVQEKAVKRYICRVVVKDCLECLEEDLIVEKAYLLVQKENLEKKQKPDSLYDGIDIYFPCLMKLSSTSFDNFQLYYQYILSHQWVKLSQLADFAKQNSKYTMLALLLHLSTLHNKGIDLSTYKGSTTTQVKASTFWHHMRY